MVKTRYLEKIECVGIDPVLLKGKVFKPDFLPPVESADILCYLVLETSFYTKEKFKNCRSSEAFNQLVSGFVTSVQGHKICNKFVVLAEGIMLSLRSYEDFLTDRHLYFDLLKTTKFYISLLYPTNIFVVLSFSNDEVSSVFLKKFHDRSRKLNMIRPRYGTLNE